MHSAPGAPPLPWHYPYSFDAPRQRDVMRPTVSAALVANDVAPVRALVDSGCEHVLVAESTAQAAALDWLHPKHEGQLRLAGSTFDVAYVDGQIRLLHPDGDDDHFIEWECEIGVVRGEWRASLWSMVLGQVGFFDLFTVSMSRAAELTVVEDLDAFDKRFGIAAAEARDDAPRRRI